MTPTETKRCARCGYDDPSGLKEYDHVFGVANSPYTELLCLNCHAKKTKIQNDIPPFARKGTAPEILKKAYALRSSFSTLKAIGEAGIDLTDDIVEFFKKHESSG
jgi:hypothetical protein